MKHKLSISIDESTYFLVTDMMRKSKALKNKSQVFEYAVKRLEEAR